MPLMARNSMRLHICRPSSAFMQSTAVAQLQVAQIERPSIHVVQGLAATMLGLRSRRMMSECMCSQRIASQRLCLLGNVSVLGSFKNIAA